VVELRFEAPKTFVMCNADVGAKATNSGFVLPVAVVPGNTEPARNIKVVVDASGLAGVARVEKGSGNNCTGGGRVWTCRYGTLHNDGESMPPFTPTTARPATTPPASRWRRHRLRRTGRPAVLIPAVLAAVAAAGVAYRRRRRAVS
jgi:hypothetical protein